MRKKMSIEEYLAKMPLVVDFLKEQHNSMTTNQCLLATQITMMLCVNDIEPTEDTAIALRSCADYVDFMLGLEKK